MYKVCTARMLRVFGVHVKELYNVCEHHARSLNRRPSSSMKDEQRHWHTTVVWFRRDLRLSDHPALCDAVDNSTAVVPLFVLDERLTRQSPLRAWLLFDTLEALGRSLTRRGSGLVVRLGSPELVVPEVARQVGAAAVLASRDVTPFSSARDRSVAEALRTEGRDLHLRPGLLLAEPESMRTSAGSPYAVFTPFWRRLQGAPRRTPLAAPERVPPPADGLPASEARPPKEHDWSMTSELPPAGEGAALERLRGWTANGLDGYDERRDHLAGEGTSHLGPDLHLGTLSPLQVEAAALEVGEGATAFVRQLAWREFYHHQLFHRRATSTRTPDHPYMAAFRPESADPGAVAAWRSGTTGIPAVDAGMRQLAATGWLSNRARLVVASFLTRHLLMDYRIGERHFLRNLIDGDVANNLGGWQWTAGVGADAQPWFRIFNPVRQGRRFDAEGDWVRRWLPELEKVPARYVHAPWEMPAEVGESIGFVAGTTYPHPIVELAEGRERALAAFRSIKA